ncbi:MAG TPA: hypothetical protein VF826_14755 [Chloroflexia bacterium]|jgi:hypothetical protein
MQKSDTDKHEPGAEAGLLRDAQWHQTFPHLIPLIDEEWLLGLLLRCDEINGWPSGTTACFLGKYSIGPGSLAKPALYITGSVLDLDRLAAAMGEDVEQVERTTFAGALQHFFSRSDCTARLLGRTPPFRICTQCVREQHLLARTSTYPLLRSCPQHRLLFRQVCHCGTPLKAFNAGTPPFTCAACMMPWENLPDVLASKEIADFDAGLSALYGVLLSQFTLKELAGVRRYVTPGVRNGGWPELPPGAFDRGMLPASTYVHCMVSISQWGACFSALQISPERLGTLVQELEYVRKYTCPNQACRGNTNVLSANVHLYTSYKHRKWEDYYYCNDCGSRFTESGRLVVTFDSNHGSRDIEPQKVARLQQQLAHWKTRLEAACVKMLDGGHPITVEEAFRRAHLSQNANLRALSLGLVSIVEFYAMRQRATVADHVPGMAQILRHIYSPASNTRPRPKHSPSVSGAWNQEIYVYAHEAS